MTGGRGPDACIDAVGMEAHGHPAVYAYDRAKQALMLESDRPIALREAIMACRNGGTVSVIGVYGGFIDKFPMGSVMNRSLTIKTGQCHVQRYMRPLLERIQSGEIDPSFVITHRLELDQAPDGYDMFLNKEDECVKVVLKPEPARARISCPVLVIHGTDDAVRPFIVGEELAEVTGGTFVGLEGSGHCPHARDPVRVNLLLRDFIAPRPAPRTWTRGRRRGKRALYVSSPIGLGHARRDIAIARELRGLHPDLEIDWLAQHPVTAALEAAGERVHPASAELSNESSHIESESAEHDLHCFQAWRRMDEILVANFMVFHDLVSDTDYDLWIADEGWEIDYYLHENPEQKRAAYAWLTDFVGWLPMPDGGEHEAAITADYNAEMIEHIARYPRVRDRAIFVGNPDDIVPDTFGPDLPAIADWTGEHFDFAGYVTGFDPSELGDRERLRAELGYGPAEQVCIVTVGGSGVGRSLLQRVMAAFPEARQHVPEPAHDRRRGAADRPRVTPCARRPRGPRLRPRPLPPPRRLRPRRRAGRPDHLDGADRQPPPVPLLPPPPPLRAEHPRPPPARALRRRPLHGLRDRDPRDHRRRDRRRDRPRRRLPPGRDRRRRRRGRPARRAPVSSTAPTGRAAASRSRRRAARSGQTPRRSCRGAAGSGESAG